MKCCVCLVLLMITYPLFSQRGRINFSEIDRQVLFIKPAAPAELSRSLTAPYSTDLEKVRSIFRWITENIDYLERQPHNRKRPSASYNQPIDTGILKPLDERVAEKVLEKRRAVCDGYARLFKTLCDYAGIRSEIITGYARTEPGKTNQRFRSNHTWNAVMIDSTWKLLDVTWASGFISWGGNIFVRHFNEQYFLAEPEEFIHEHYPDDPRWTLMTDPPTVNEFRHSPFRQKAYLKYKISRVWPSKGIIEAAPGDTIEIVLESADKEYDHHIAGSTFTDTALYTTMNSALLTPVFTATNTTKYIYTVNARGIEWLYILYNEDVILRYRLVVRKENALIR